MTQTFRISLGLAWGLLLPALMVPMQACVAAQESAGIAVGEEEVSPPTTINLRMTPTSVPDFTFSECMGEEFGLEDLKGRRWVASFIFTRCVLTCRKITQSIKDLHDRVGRENPDVMFITFTVDPEYDTPEILREYASIFEADHSRWKFLTGDADEIRGFIVRGLGSYVKENVGEDRRPGMEVAHSNQVILINENAEPVGKYLGTNDGEMAELAQVLAGRKDFPTPGTPIHVVTPDGAPPGVEIEIVERSGGSSAATDSDPAEDTNATPSGEQSARVRVLKIERLLPEWAKRLPSTNAMLNCTAAVLLCCGWLAIRSGNRGLHRKLMTMAFLTSVAFLGCYLASHWALHHYASERGRPFVGGPVATRVYYAILVPHVILAALVPVLAVRVFMHAFAERWDQHRRLARLTFPIWLYVSVTGVVIYGMLYHWPK